MPTIQEYTVKGDLAGVKVALKAEGVNKQDSYGEAALHEAGRHGHDNIAAFLLSQGADTKIAAFKNNGWQPLHISAKYGKTEVSRLLIAAKAGINNKDAHGDTPLIHAAKSGDKSLEVARFLIRMGADVNLKGKDNKTALEINSKLSPDGEPVKFGQSTIQECGAKGNLSGIKFLLKQGVPVSAEDSYGESALHETGRHGHEEVAAFLLSKGAVHNKGAHKNNGWQPIHIAGKYGKSGVVRALAAARADLNAKDGNGDTALILAAKSKEKALDTARLLLALGADPSITDKAGKTAAAHNPAINTGAPARAATSASRVASSASTSAPAAVSVTASTSTEIKSLTTGFTPASFVFQSGGPLGVSGGGKTAFQKDAVHTSNGICFGDKAFSSGKHTWTLKVQKGNGNYMDIGVTGSREQFRRPISGLHAAGRTIIEQKGCGTKKAEAVTYYPFHTGTTVQVLLDMTAKTVSFVVTQGTSQKVVKDALTDLPGEVYPAVMLRNQGHQVTLV